MDSTAARGAVHALDVLALIPVMHEHHQDYDRDRFGYPSDADGDGCDTRADVLRRDSLTPARVNPSGCDVIAGEWLSAYDGITLTDPREVEIDHVVPLKEAWDSGAWAWPPNRLVAYGNDLDDDRSLRAVTSAVNQSKGDADPSNWLPPDQADVCPYIGDWVSIKARWGLSMDESEAGRIRKLLNDRCADELIAPWPPAPGDLPSPTSPPPPPPATQSPPVLPQPGNCDASYPDVCIPAPPPDLDCKDIPHRRFRVLPPDPHNFDGGTKNGIGCESD